MTQDRSDATEAQKASHWRPFWLGVFAGLVGLVAIGALSDAMARPQLRFKLAGADVSALGGTKITIVDASHRWTQTCNGVCDDVTHIAHSIVPSLGLSVTDGRGHCLLCEPDIYIEPSAPLDLSISGVGKLKLGYKPWRP